MQIQINGEQKEFTASISLSELIDTLGLAPQRIAVEVNKQIVPKSAWENTALKNDDRVEIVHFVGGGAPGLNRDEPYQKCEVAFRESAR